MQVADIGGWVKIYDEQHKLLVTDFKPGVKAAREWCEQYMRSEPRAALAIYEPSSFALLAATAGVIHA